VTFFADVHLVTLPLSVLTGKEYNRKRTVSFF
jgi:hypothetical protein